jgi:hypothetical protein
LDPIRYFVCCGTAGAVLCICGTIALGNEIIYLRTLLANMQLRQSDYTPVFEDNTVCIEWANHVIGGRERAKHIDIRKHFAHEAVQNGHMRLYKIATEFQLADILTKALQLHQFESCLHGLLEDAED